MSAIDDELHLNNSQDPSIGSQKSSTTTTSLPPPPPTTTTTTSSSNPELSADSELQSIQHQRESISLSDKKIDDSSSPAEAPPASSPEPQEPKLDYIITLKQDTTKEQYELYKTQLIDQGAEIKHEYFSIILKGYAVSLKPSKLQSFQQDPVVKDVELDQKVHI